MSLIFAFAHHLLRDLQPEFCNCLLDLDFSHLHTKEGGKLVSVEHKIEKKMQYSRLSNNYAGWNKHVGMKFPPKIINV